MFFLVPADLRQWRKKVTWRGTCTSQRTASNLGARSPQQMEYSNGWDKAEDAPTTGRPCAALLAALMTPLLNAAGGCDL